MKQDLNEKKEAQKQDIKKEYESPDYSSHKPLEIMSRYQDKSSELNF